MRRVRTPALCTCSVALRVPSHFARENPTFVRDWLISSKIQYLLFQKFSTQAEWKIGQPQVAFTWNTLSAAAYWTSRISLEALLTSAHAINEIIARDVAAAAERAERQPNPDPNAAYRDGLPAGVVLTRRRPNRARGGA